MTSTALLLIICPAIGFAVGWGLAELVTRQQRKTQKTRPF